MKSHQNNKNVKKHILVISDLHLGAGMYIDGKRNLLEDFHSQNELISFFEYFSSGEYSEQNIELVINGDFLDLLAVPYIRYFDDEYWSEKASLEKLTMILNAHKKVMKALASFASRENRKIIYIIGNHDSELVFPSLKEKFLLIFEEKDRYKVTISNDLTLYNPVKGIYIQHGHEYEEAHQFDPTNTTITSSKGEKYFIPSWGSYYVTHVVNKYKHERNHINEVKPIRTFLIHGLIFDTYFTVRFMLANAYYYFMVRFLYYYRLKLGWQKIIEDALQELSMWADYETLTRDFFKDHKEARVLIVGHTHKPALREFNDGTMFVNTGTWMRTVNLDLRQNFSDVPRTFAHIQVFDEDITDDNFHEAVRVNLHRWAPKTLLPFEEYN